TPAAAEDFYKGKSVTLFIDAGGGSYESYARLLAQYMPRYIPGQPAIVVKQMLGASGLRLTNYMYNVAPKDGTEIAGVHAQIPTQPLFSRQGIQYNPDELSWIGNLTRETFVEYVWHTSPVQSIADSRAKEAIIGGQAPGSMSIDTAILSNAIIGTKFKIVTGYSGLPETLLALERGEINGGVGAYGEFVSAKPDWLKDGKIKFIAQLGLQKNNNIPDVPLLIDLIATPGDRRAMELFLSRGVTGKPYFAPPGLPKDRLAILRSAFDSAVKDPDLLADAAKQRFEINEPMNGVDLADFVAKENATPLSAVQRINEAFAQYTSAQ
ncbi:MAG TPA: tripartite tricarboxylate transporter substrate-binding protein, partial [Beijerinckiaceae bacterium]|nr:tripartite tricarboxylate transporter substrate-binding protein [Beijerinckiaceae bacterium]